MLRIASKGTLEASGEAKSYELYWTYSTDAIGLLQLRGNKSYTRSFRSSLQMQYRTELTELANILQIQPSQVKDRYIGSSPTLFSSSGPLQVRSDKKNIVYTIVALGDMSYMKGLPAMGEQEEKVILRKGEALHFLGDVKRTYNGTGAPMLLIQWKNKRSEP